MKFSDNWLNKVKRKYGISVTLEHGEAGSAPQEVVDAIRKWLPAFFELVGVDLEDIFNNDETGLFFRQLPRRTLGTKGKKLKGLKVAKDRITVLLCANVLGAYNTFLHAMNAS